MRHIEWTLRIALLWVAVAGLTLTHMLLEVVSPKAIDELRTGQLHGMRTDGPVTLVWVVFVLVPLLMAWLVFVVPETSARWANGVLGVISAVIWIPLPGSDEAVTPGLILVTVAVIVAGLAIAWLAGKGPAQAPDDRRPPIRGDSAVASGMSAESRTQQ